MPRWYNYALRRVTVVKFLSGICLGVLLTLGTLSLSAQPGEALTHPRLVHAIEAIQDARAYLLQAPVNFGFHKAAAIKACDEAIKQLQAALEFRAQQDHRH
jgi:hypothetical protein